MSKRIGLVLPSVPGYSETFFKNKINGLISNGFEVVLFVNGDTKVKYYENTNVKIISVNQFSKNQFLVLIKGLIILMFLVLFSFTRVKKFYVEEKKDGKSFLMIIKSLMINHVFFNYLLEWIHFGFGTMVLGRENLAKAIGAKMAVSFRGFDYYVYPVKNENCYKTLFSKEVKYHVLSDAMKKELIEKGIQENCITKITPAIDLSLFKTEDDLKPNHDDVIRISTVARLHWIKGLEYTLEALSILKEKRVRFQYTIIGDGVEKERLQFLTYQLGLQECITFTGKLTPQEIKKKLEETDLYLQYSIQEGFCNAVLEAQAMGKVCIVSDADGLMENVVDNVTGFVVPKRKPVSLAAKILEVINLSDSDKKVIITRAIERVKKEFSIDKQRENFISFYKNN